MAGDKVKAEARKVMLAMSIGGGYIAAPSQDIQSDVPVANMLALLEQLKEFG